MEYVLVFYMALKNTNEVVWLLETMLNICFFLRKKQNKAKKKTSIDFRVHTTPFF